MTNFTRKYIAFMILSLTFYFGDLSAQPGPCDPLEDPCEQNVICFGTFEEFDNISDFQGYISDFDFPGQDGQTADLIMLNGNNQPSLNGHITLWNGFTCSDGATFPTASEGDQYAGISYHHYGRMEGMSLPLNSSLQPNRTYKLDLDNRILGTQDNNCITEVKIFISENAPCPDDYPSHWESCGTFDRVEVASFWATKATYWEAKSFMFTVPASGPSMNYITLITSDNEGGYSYVYLDNFSLIKENCYQVEDAEYTICEGNQIQLDVVTEDFNNPTYNWSPSIPGCQGCSSPVVSPSSTVDYVVTVSEGGNSASGTYTVNVISDPDVYAGHTQYKCEGDLVTLNGTFNSEGGEVLEWLNDFGQVIGSGPSYSYTIGGGFLSNQRMFGFRVTKGNCTWTDYVTVNQYPNPVANAGNDLTICEGESVDLNGIHNPLGNGYFYYSWSTSGLQNFNGSRFQKNVNVGPLTENQTYTFKVNSGEAGSCQGEDVMTVFVIKDPNILFDNNQIEMCSGDEVSITAQYTSTGNETASWFDDDGTLLGTGATYSYHAASTAEPTEVLTFKVSESGCNYVETVTITIYPNPEVDAGEDVTICEGTEAYLSASLVGGANDQGYSYYWSPANRLNPNPSGNVANKTSVLLYQTTTFTVRAVSAEGCESSDTKTVFVLNSPSPNAGVDQKVCNGDLVYLQGSYSGQQNLSVAWFNASGTLVSNSHNYSFIVDEHNPIDQIYTYKVTDGSCSWEDEVRVQSFMSPTISLDEELEVCAGDMVNLTAVLGGQSGQFTTQWTTSGIYNFNGSSTQNSVMVGPVDVDQTYRVTVTNSGNVNCSSYAEITVAVIPDYNLVPNGDMELGSTPNNRSEIEASTGWYSVTGDPDLFDENYNNCLPAGIQACHANGTDINCMDVPCNYYGYLSHTNADNGHRYAGLWTASGSQAGDFASVLKPLLGGTIAIDNISSTDKILSIVEGMGIRLPQALDPSKTYEMTLLVSKAPKGLGGRLTQTDSAHFNVKMTNYKVESTIPFQEVPAYRIGRRATASVGAWEEITIIFQPNYVYDYLIIESTYPGNVKEIVDDFGSIGIKPTNPDLPPVGIESYMYLDNIYIKEYCPVAQARFASDESAVEEVELESSDNITVFPNPTQGSLTLQYEDLVSVSSRLEIMNASGSLVMKKTFGSGTGSMSLDISNLPEGIYFYHIIDINNDVLKRDKIVLVK
jgi:hypothetical protein